ncbi:glutamine--fructose-6-phosphate transaminase (isomerizing) [Desulfovibrio litoralis]|uniref:Glutamine--fructose-6-phosphate aminotransferase [isomerizing] n=1 Tax=Desulfovibrio litoralis DSM 11393 TaxID=1121455 RepID=A0A1M7SM27_9BACT|nr:glutamine--fructose-6-phosphate transaminase (isomerizing) [Desulfovibrio litoralis]SHN59533.1 glutamine--fructose-6-phosphate transaminase [Desulfovibrio litoralis DSM 11393]
MCGIIAYTGHRPAVPVVIEGLRRLEYRGYDSAGVSFIQNNELLNVVRAAGKLNALEQKLSNSPNILATVGMGHTRWATHGIPVERNAHPHKSFDGSLSIIHNGIIENFQELKNDLLAKGYKFYSDTDTEVLVNLISEERKNTTNLMQAFANALNKAHGAYAVALMSKEEPDSILAARMHAPLILGLGVGENFVASDVPAFLNYTRDVVFLDDGELVKITANSWELRSITDLGLIEKKVQRINWDMQAASKGGFKHFMLKEIFEQPKVISDCLVGRIDKGKSEVKLPELNEFPTPERLHIVACGTSYNAGLWGQHLFESWAKIPVTVEIASEFRYRDVILNKNDLVLVISQSGETADTLACLRLVKSKGIPVVALTNVVGSSIAREANASIYTQAGPEISVASTKAMTSQMILLSLMALYFAKRQNNLDKDILKNALEGLSSLEPELNKVLPKLREKAQELALLYSGARSFFFLGRGVCYPLAEEGALKLKELSYIHAEGYAAGEMKHGPIALIDQDFPTFALAFNDSLFPKVKSNIEEVQARQGKVIALTHEKTSLTTVDNLWIIPEVWGVLNSFIALPALQLFSYEVADYLGKDVDQPRNLAKSVTVE